MIDFDSVEKAIETLARPITHYIEIRGGDDIVRYEITNEGITVTTTDLRNKKSSKIVQHLNSREFAIEEMCLQLTNVFNAGRALPLDAYRIRRKV